MEELANYIHLSIHSYKRSDAIGASQFLQFAVELFHTVFPVGKTIVKSIVLQVFDEPLRYIYMCVFVGCRFDVHNIIL